MYQSVGWERKHIVSVEYRPSNPGSVVSMRCVPVTTVEDSNRLVIFGRKSPKETDETLLILHLVSLSFGTY